MANIPIRITVDYSSVSQATQGIQSAFNRTAASVQRTAGRTVSQTIRQFANMADAVGRSFRNTLNNVRDSIGLIGRAIGVLSFGELIHQVTTLNSEFIGLKNTLISVEAESINVGRQINFIRAESERLGQPISELGKQFSQLNAAATGTQLEGEGVRDIFSAIAETSRILQLSTDDTAGALRAIQQVISKGTVQAEELRGQLGERLPGAFQIAARAMGETTEGLEDMIKAGDLMAEDFLPKFANELRKTFGKALPEATKTAAAELQRVKNSLTILTQEITSRLDPVVAEVFGNLNDMLKGIDTAKLSKDIIKFFADVLDSAADVIDFIQGSGYLGWGLLTSLLIGPKGGAGVAALLAFKAEATKAVKFYISLLATDDIEAKVAPLQERFETLLYFTEQFRAAQSSIESGGFANVGGVRLEGAEGLERIQELLKNTRSEIDSVREQISLYNGEIIHYNTLTGEAYDTTSETTNMLRYFAAKLLEASQAESLLTIEINSGNTALVETNRLLGEQLNLWERMVETFPELTDHMKEFETFEDIIERIDEASVGWFDSFADNLTELVTTGKTNFRSLAQSILRDLIKMQIQAAITNAVMAGLSAIGGGFIGSTGAGNVGAQTSMAGQFGGGSIGLAQGGVVGNGKLQAFAKGGVVDSPTIFPMAKGTGLMGEAGPEAVMPLQRDSDGNLGVSGGGGSGVTIVNVLDASLLSEYVESFEGEKVIVNVISRNKEAVNNSLQG